MVRFIINRKTNYLYKKSILKIQDAFYFHFILSSQTIYKNQILLYNCFYYNYYFIIYCVCRVKGLLLLWNVKISHPDLALSLFLQAVAFSIYYRHVRRRLFRTYLSIFPAHSRIAYHGSRIFSRPRQLP